MVTQREKEQALEALAAYRRRLSQSGAAADGAASVETELWEAAGVPVAERLTEGTGGPLSWTALKKRIKDVGKDHGRHAASTELVVRYLLDWSSSHPQPAQPVPPGTSRLIIGCPNTIFDYRALILGQLPEFDRHTPLFPAVFIKPNDGTGYWYPQCSYHNPLVLDRAFACLAHFGNPSAISHRRARLPLRFEVRAYALRTKWTRSERLALADLDDLVDPLRDPALALQNLDYVELAGDDDVTRNPTGIGAIHVTDQSGPVALVQGQLIDCTSPLIVSWDGEGSARIEIRDGVDDKKVWDDAVSSGLALYVTGKPRPSAEVAAELKPGLHRVRLHPQKPSFLGPAHEWWFNLT